MKKTDVIHKSGKRKRAIARATLKKGKGKVKVNGVFLDNFGDRVSQLRIKEPLVLAGETAKKVDVFVRVNGGGINGQADAARLAIARALVDNGLNGEDGEPDDTRLYFPASKLQMEAVVKKTFDDYDRLLLVADVRRKEVCKPNISKARAKRQKSYR